ncbi:hypothetical protein DSO57_1031015 [Entomophthora muscae]|uniref:Uncharacterized protein n=1 Tax=Entomophthora muscae TaxID=34485 RepID=A0ACC2UAQ9_9FUNG|nr:hypothetical protein DSO57_1031015 [Entomophthora muscae]
MGGDSSMAGRHVAGPSSCQRERPGWSDKVLITSPAPVSPRTNPWQYAPIPSISRYRFTTNHLEWCHAAISRFLEILVQKCSKYLNYARLEGQSAPLTCSPLKKPICRGRDIWGRSTLTADA